MAVTSFSDGTTAYMVKFIYMKGFDGCEIVWVFWKFENGELLETSEFSLWVHLVANVPLSVTHVNVTIHISRVMSLPISWGILMFFIY